MQEDAKVNWKKQWTIQEKEYVIEKIAGFSLPLLGWPDDDDDAGDHCGVTLFSMFINMRLHLPLYFVLHLIDIDNECSNRLRCVQSGAQVYSCSALHHHHHHGRQVAPRPWWCSLRTVVLTDATISIPTSTQVSLDTSASLVGSMINSNYRQIMWTRRMNKKKQLQAVKWIKKDCHVQNLNYRQSDGRSNA